MFSKARSCRSIVWHAVAFGGLFRCIRVAGCHDYSSVNGTCHLQRHVLPARDSLPERALNGGVDRPPWAVVYRARVLPTSGSAVPSTAPSTVANQKWKASECPTRTPLLRCFRMGVRLYFWPWPNSILTPNTRRLRNILADQVTCMVDPTPWICVYPTQTEINPFFKCTRTHTSYACCRGVTTYSCYHERPASRLTSC